LKIEGKTDDNNLKEEITTTTHEPRGKSQHQKQKESAYAWIWKGWFLFILGKVEVARKCYDKAIELDSRNPYGWGGKFWTYFVLGKVAEFIESAEKGTDRNPENKYAWIIESLTYFVLGKVEKSLEFYEKYIELDKIDNNKDYNTIRAQDYEWTIKGYLLYLLEKFDKAINCVDKALEIKLIDKKYVLALKGEILNSIGKYEEAIRCYDRAIDEKSRHVWYDDWSGALVWTWKGNALSNLGKYEEAIRCYDRALEINPNYPIVVLINKSGMLFSNDAINTWLAKVSTFSSLDIDVILEIYEKLLENSPNNPYAWTWKGNALSNLGKYEEAIRCYDRALEINPNYALAQTNKNILIDRCR
jgi:tetratricopeptide (TPR) repeat protein